MTDTDLHALLRAARRVSQGEPLSTELLGAEGVPAALRLVTTTIALAAAGRPLTKKTITTAAPAARSAAYRDNADLLAEAIEVLPALVAAQLQLAGQSRTATQLSRELQQANESIERERKRRREAEENLHQVLAYARELHWRLKPEYDALLRERESKVRPLRSLTTAHNEPTAADDGQGDNA
ncbi:MAG: hypothetical protein IPJ14_21950 [Kineosporiaceae bacterium]|nr:hypothetical protein [Kineosporiaceae bacterium]